MNTSLPTLFPPGLRPLGELFQRRREPILSVEDWPYPAAAVFNPGAVLHDGQTLLLCRVEDRRGLSHLTVARSDDGRTGWTIDRQPLLTPADDPQSCYGLEDPRITWVEEMGGYVIAYVRRGLDGTGIALAVTRDFRTVEPIGAAMPPADSNAALLPRHIDGRFVLFHRPVAPRTRRADIWLSRSSDLRSWGSPEPVLTARSGAWWDSARVGIGPPPIETQHGWLALYHGVKEAVGGAIWRAGLVLFDRDDPARILRRSDEWVLAPTAPFETSGQTPQRIFPTGLTHDTATDELRVYYGAADTSIGMAVGSLSAVVERVLAYPAYDAARPPAEHHER
jgi:predicted GH43/DUF377 family glycosyl hydrolase